jgi:type II secretory pathway component PulF
MAEPKLRVTARRRAGAQSATTLAAVPAPANASSGGAQSKAGYKFVAVSSSGHHADYHVPIESRDEAREALEAAGMTVKRIVPRSSVRRKRAKFPKRMELVPVAEQLGDQWEAGVPPTRILETLGESQPNPFLMHALLNAAVEVRNGATVSEALAMQDTVNTMPDLRKRQEALAAGKKGKPIFPTTFVHAVFIAEDAGAITDPITGEKRGAMQVMMERFADDQTRIDALMSAIRGAMMYPIGVMGVVIAVIAIMLYFAVPKLKEMYDAMTNGQQLPLPTRILIAASNFCISPLGLVMGLALFIFVLGFVAWSRTEKGRDFVGRKALWIPLFGEMLRERNMAQVARVLGMMSSGGGSLNKALRETAAATTNPAYREMVEDVLFEFEREARPLYVLFRPYTPLTTDAWHTNLISYEKSGGLDKLCARFAAVLERRNERRVETIKHVLNTYLIIPIAVFVAGVVIALYMPLFSLVGHMANAGK